MQDAIPAIADAEETCRSGWIQRAGDGKAGPVPVGVSFPSVIRRARGQRDIEIVRACGVAITILLGPAAGVVAWQAFGMGPMEIGALVFLISGWLGPRLMGLGWK